MIKVALNGSRTSRDHPGVPVGAEAQAVDAAERTVAGMEASLHGAEVRQPRLLHGMDATAWHFIREAATKGYDKRVGFEDVLVLPDGRPAPDNAALVAAARDLVAAAAGC